MTPPAPVIDLRDVSKTYHVGETSVHALQGAARARWPTSSSRSPTPAWAVPIAGAAR